MKTLSPKQCVFVSEIALGKSVSHAALTAGYSPSYARRGCYRLAKHSAIVAALDEAREKIRDQTTLTAERFMAKLEVAYAKATAANQHTAAARCLELQGKLAGLLVDRQHTLVETVDMTAALAEAKARAAHLGSTRFSDAGSLTSRELPPMPQATQ